MRRVSIFFCLISALLPVARGASDAGASYNLLLKHKLTEEWFLISRSNLASRQHYDDNFFGYTGLGLGYNLNENWSLRVGYRHAWIRPGDGWLEENRPYVETYYMGDWEGRQKYVKEQLRACFAATHQLSYTATKDPQAPFSGFSPSL